MAIQDSLGLFHNAAIPTPIATTKLDNVVDLQTAARDVGIGNPIDLLIMITANVTSAGAPTVVFNIETGSSTALNTIVQSSASFLKAALVIGKIIPISFIPIGTAEKFLGVSVTVAVAALTGGSVVAVITSGPYQSNLLGAA